MKKHIFLGLFILSFAACAHHHDVREGADGTNRVVTRAGERDIAERNAISQATHFCKEMKLHPVFITEKTTYTGSMDEKDRETLKNISTAAMVIAGPQSPAHSAGTAGYIVTNGNDYTSDMTFKCQ